MVFLLVTCDKCSGVEQHRQEDADAPCLGFPVPASLPRSSVQLLVWATSPSPLHGLGLLGFTYILLAPTRLSAGAFLPRKGSLFPPGPLTQSFASVLKTVVVR